MGEVCCSAPSAASTRSRELTRLDRLQLLPLLIKYSLDFLSLIIQNRNLLRTKSIEEGLYVSSSDCIQFQVAYLVVNKD
jgi:hypothetical protein